MTEVGGDAEMLAAKQEIDKEFILLRHQYSPTSMVHFTCSINIHRHQWFNVPAA